MNVVLTIAVSVLASASSFFGLYKYLPIHLLDGPAKYGTSITTINGTDTLSGSRTTINNNFSALNTGKVEVSDLAASTSLPQLTITGISPAGVVTAPFGGTGSTTLSASQVLLGNGASNIKTVNGFGTSGQFLTSGGTGVAPTWTTGSLDLTADYVWTGAHTFPGSSSKKLTINSIAYVWPTTQTASSSALQTDASGNLSWVPTTRLLDASSTLQTVTATSASTTIYAVSVPANGLGKSGDAHLHINIKQFGINTAEDVYIEASYGNGTTTVALTNSTGGNFNTVGWLDFVVTGSNSTSAQGLALNLYSIQSGVGTPAKQMIAVSTGSATADSTTAQRLQLVIRFSTNSGNSIVLPMNGSILLER